jgi:hypothetical protein
MLKNLTHSYSLYKKENKNYIDLSLYLKINHLFLKFIIKLILEGVEVVLPSKLGKLSVRGKKQKIRYDENGNLKGLAPNWVATKKLRESNEEAKKARKIVYHTNLHSDGIRYKYYWRKNFISNKSLYSLRITRENKRALSKLIFSGKDYYSI